MRRGIDRLAFVVVCLLGLSLLPCAATAGGSSPTPPQIDKSAGTTQLSYPAEAQARGEEGTIDFEMHISSGGHPTGRYKIYKSTGFKDLDDAAIQSALGWNYVPGKNADGEAVSAWIPLHLDFRLPEPASAAASTKPTP